MYCCAGAPDVLRECGTPYTRRRRVYAVGKNGPAVCKRFAWVMHSSTNTVYGVNCGMYTHLGPFVFECSCALPPDTADTSLSLAAADRQMRACTHVYAELDGDAEPDGDASRVTFYQLGMAKALNKPIVLRYTSLPPSVLQSLLE